MSNRTSQAEDSQGPGPEAQPSLEHLRDSTDQHREREFEKEEGERLKKTRVQTVRVQGLGSTVCRQKPNTSKAACTEGVSPVNKRIKAKSE